MDLQVVRRRIGERLAGPRLAAAASFVDRHGLAVAVFIVLFLVLQLARAAGRTFWFDELFTFFISRQPRLSDVLHALPADGNPPLSYLLVRLSMRLFGETEVAARLPSIVAFTWTAIAAYLFVRRHCAPIAAALSVFALVTGQMSFYGTEARPYALVVGFTALALLSWQSATGPGGRRLLALAGVSLGIAGAIASHHYGVFQVAAPLVAGELVRLKQRRRIDLPLCAAGFLGLSTLLWTVPFALRTNQIMLVYTRAASTYVDKPTVANLLSYDVTTSPWLIGVLIAALWFTRPVFAPADAQTRAPGAIPAHEMAAAAALALLMPIMIGVAWATTGVFLPRYAIGTTLGVATLTGFAVQRLAVSARQTAVVATLCMAAVTAGYVVSRVTTFGLQIVLPALMRPQHVNAVSVLAKAPPDLPIVVGPPVEFMPTKWYAPADLRRRLHYLQDPAYAVTQPSFLGDISLSVNRDVLPFEADDYATFLRANRRFLLYCMGRTEDNWVKTRLLAEGWKLQLLSQAGLQSLFEVRAPSE
jgi:hypothetical protein